MLRLFLSHSTKSETLQRLRTPRFSSSFATSSSTSSSSSSSRVVGIEGVGAGERSRGSNRQGLFPREISSVTRKKLMARARTPLEYELQRQRTEKPQGSVEGTLWVWKYRVDELLKEKRVEEALQQVEEIKKQGVRVDVIGYTKLLHSCKRAKNLKLAEHVWSCMESDGVQGDVYAFSEMIDLQRRLGSPEGAMYWFYQLKKHNIRPTATTYGILLHMRADRKEWELVDMLEKMMAKDNVTHNYVSAARLLFIFCRENLVERVEKLWKVVRTNPNVNYSLYAVRMRMHHQLNDKRSMVALYREMMPSKKLRPRQDVLNMMKEAGLLDAQNNLIVENSQKPAQ